MANTPKTAAFHTPGLLPPNAEETSRLGLEQQMLLEALQSQGNVSVPTRDTGKFQVLNFDGIGNSIAGNRSREALDLNRKKMLDVNMAYSKELAGALKRFDTTDQDDPASLAEGMNSPHAAVRERAADALKTQRSRFDKLTERSSLASIQASKGNIGGLAPKSEIGKLADVLYNATEGANPALLPGQGFDQVPDPNKAGQVVNRNRFTGEMGLNKAPQTSVVVSSGQKASDAFMVDEAKALSENRVKIASAAPAQFRALASAQEAAKNGAFQGPLSGFVQAAAGVATQFGLSADQTKQLLSNTEIINSDMGRFVLSAIKALGTNPSNADREYADRVAGGKTLSPAGLEAVIRAGRTDIVNNMIQHNKHVDRLSAKFPEADIARLDLPELANVHGGQKLPIGMLDIQGFLPGPDGMYLPEGRDKAVEATPSASPSETRQQKLDRLNKKYGS